MLGIVVCPRCSRVRGVDLTMKTVRCPVCGQRIEVSKAKVYFRTDSRTELAEAVRRMAEEIAPSLDKCLGSTKQREPTKEKGRMDEVGLRTVATMLTRRRGDFNIDDLAREIVDLEKEHLESILQKMLSAGLIYEASPGRYRSV